MSHKSTRLHEHAEQQQQEQKNTDHHEQTFEGNQQPQLPDDDVTDLPVEPEMGIQHEEEETLHALYQKTQLIENQLQQKIQLIENQLHHEIQTINDKIEIMTNQFEEQMKELKSIIQNEQTARVTSNRLIEPRDIPLDFNGMKELFYIWMEYKVKQNLAKSFLMTILLAMITTALLKIFNRISLTIIVAVLITWILNLYME
ncbi:unnamed protein product [Adineta ricciae]|uniref:Uncharacterized protein n=1 Tax=Adineta ricciae TaxID=249248 RepID=A0A815ZNU5_ADIRI|nr:unnamed protein product [Adineta ricciae]